MSMDINLRKLIDRAEIDDLITNFAQGGDNPDPELLLSVFAPNARIEWDGLEPIEGREELKRIMYDGTFKNVTKMDLKFAIHAMVNRKINVDGSDHATGIVHCASFLTGAKEGEPHYAIRGLYYEDKYERIDGKWYISFRRHTLRWLMEGEPSPLPAGVRLASNTISHPFAGSEVGQAG